MIDITPEMLAEHFRDWQPTPEAVNALPEPLLHYSNRLERLSDPAGLVRENVLLRDQIAALVKKVDDDLRKEWNREAQ